MPPPKYDPADPVPMNMEDALTIAMAEQALAETWRDTVRRYVCFPSDDWRTCCSSGCDPCTEQLGRAVDRVRHMVGILPSLFWTET